MKKPQSLRYKGAVIFPVEDGYLVRFGFNGVGPRIFKSQLAAKFWITKTL